MGNQALELFKKLRDSIDGIIKAYEDKDEEAMEAAMGKFLVLCMQIGALK